MRTDFRKFVSIEWNVVFWRREGDGGGGGEETLLRKSHGSRDIQRSEDKLQRPRSQATKHATPTLRSESPVPPHVVVESHRLHHRHQAAPTSPQLLEKNGLRARRPTRTGHVRFCPLANSPECSTVFRLCGGRTQEWCPWQAELRQRVGAQQQPPPTSDHRPHQGPPPRGTPWQPHPTRFCQTPLRAHAARWWPQESSGGRGSRKRRSKNNQTCWARGQRQSAPPHTSPGVVRSCNASQDVADGRSHASLIPHFRLASTDVDGCSLASSKKLVSRDECCPTENKSGMRASRCSPPSP